jgi:ribosomal protein S6--L-glutamate ligase
MTNPAAPWPHAPPHRLSESGTFMVTAGTLNKYPVFRGPDRLTFLHDKLLEAADRFGWRLAAWAVFPNHYHFIAESPDHPGNLSSMIAHLHAETAREVNRLDASPGRQVWFQFWETLLTHETSYLARLNYVIENPVRHGVASVPTAYRWCSAGWFEQRAEPSFVRTVRRFKTDRVRVVDGFEVRAEDVAGVGSVEGTKVTTLPDAAPRREPKQPERRKTAALQKPPALRIALLSAGEGWHVQDLLRAGRELGLALSVVPFASMVGRVGPSAVEGAGADLLGADRVLVRIVPPGSLEQVVFRMDALHRLEAAGVPVVNPPRAVETAVDKYLATARLEAAGLPVPQTAACESAEAAMAEFERLGGDVVVKPLFGSQGRGLMRVSDPDLAVRAFSSLERLGSVLYLQRFIPHPGWDLRAFVLGGRVLAAMRRRSQDWRTNVARGAVPEPVTLSDEEADLAVRAAAAVGAEIAGVDLLPGPEGERYVLEVNAVPGWEALSRACDLDVAAEVLRYVAAKEPR